MSRIRLSTLAQMAEIIAALGVIGSLIYVGLELKENTSAVRAATVHSITTSSRDVLVDIALDDDFPRLRRIGESDHSQLTEDEAYRFFAFNRANWIFLQGVWIQRNLGVLDDRAWASYERIICEIIRRPGNREDWSNHASALDSEFVEIVETCPN